LNWHFSSCRAVGPGLVLWASLVFGGCERSGPVSGELWGHEPPAVPTLVRSFELPEAAPRGALLSGPRGLLWITVPGALLALDPATGEVRLRAEPDALATAVPLGADAEQIYVRAGSDLVRLNAEGSVRARRPLASPGAVALDPLGRHVLVGTDVGAVIGLHPRQLRPSWAWPRLGAPATALAVSPEGDRVYLALAPAGASDGARLLQRDAQTGRVLHETDLTGTVEDLRATAAGTVLAVLRDDSGYELLALRASDRGLVTIWRRPISAAAPRVAVRLRVDDRGRRVALLKTGGDAGLVILDAGDGSVLSESADAPLDAAFGAHGALYLLYPREIRVLQ
jgi:hypothetical protein